MKLTFMRQRIACAAAIGILFLLLHLAGARRFVAVLSGTAIEGWGPTAAATLGVSYTLCYLAVVVVAPILVLSVLLETGANSLLRHDERE